MDSIAKVLQHAAMCKQVSYYNCSFQAVVYILFRSHKDTHYYMLPQFEGENAALSSMNPYIKESFGRFRYLFSEYHIYYHWTV